MQEVENLLQKVSQLKERFYAAHESKNITERFNVFKVLGVEIDERKICRFLCEILSPSGSHGLKIFFLKSFTKRVLGLNIPDYQLEKAEVRIEYPIENRRRIDIVIRSKVKEFQFFIPIEVKIWAQDRNEQCKAYYDEAENHSDDAKIFYLTPDGHAPSPESSCGVPAKSMKCISFEDDIYDWISYCIGQPEVIRYTPLREVLLQFAVTVKKFTEQTMEEKLTMEVAKLITQSPENLKVAGEIILAIVNVLQTKLFETVEKSLKEKGYEPVRGKGLHYTDESCKTSVLFYSNRENDDTKPGVRFDVEDYRGADRLYIGEFTPGSKRWGDFDTVQFSEGGCVDFRNIKHLIRLCDETTMKDFATQCVATIEKYLETVNTPQENA